MSTSTRIDLAVIGSGGAGMAAAITARGAGRSVVVIERHTLGGTCVNIGCIPSKTLLAAAGTRHDALTNPFPGAPTTAGAVDLAALVAQKDELTARLRRAKYADVADAHGFEVRTGQARFRDADTLEVDGHVLDAGAVLVATGAEPAIPDLPGLGAVDVLTSTTAMEQTSLPESLVVIGGGYVGAEQAQLFAHLGARVTLVGRLAPRAEPELSRRLREVFEADGITVIEEHAATVTTTGSQVTVTTHSGRRATGQRLLVATGRRARTDGLNLAGAGIEVDQAGFIVADTHQRTTNPRVWAAGDVTGAPQYVYVASATGRVAAANALGIGAAPTEVDYTGLPQVMFTHPQLASAGLTEAEATAAGHDCQTRVLDLAEVPRALVNRDVRGAIAMVADARTGTILGVHALADGAGEIMLAATYAIRAGMTVDDVAGTWAPYLTMAESLRLVAGQFAARLPLSCCA
jgi:mercuric reductase